MEQRVRTFLGWSGEHSSQGEFTKQQTGKVGGDEGLRRGSAERGEELGSADRYSQNGFPSRYLTDICLMKDALGRRRKDRGGGSGRQGGNTDINNSVLGDETGEVQGGKTIMIQSCSKSIRSFFYFFQKGTGLHSNPSYSSFSKGTSDVAGSCTWSDLVCSGSGAICGSGVDSSFHIMARAQCLWWVLVLWSLGWWLWMVRCFHPDGEGGTVVKEYPVLILLERPLMTVSGQARSRLCIETSPEKGIRLSSS